MTKTTRETEQRRNTNVFKFSLIATSILILFGCFITGMILNEKISELPHKYCHNEYKTELIKITNTNAMEIIYTNYNISDEITCEDGVEVEEYKAIGVKNINICPTTCTGLDKTCIIKSTKEVCEIR